MTEINTERNRDLVIKRVTNPKKWGWGALGKLYGIHRQSVKEIYERDVLKYASKGQVKAYKVKLAKRLQRM